MPISIIILSIVLILIAVRKLFPFRLCIWMIMAAGAIAVLVLQQISISRGIKSISTNIMFYLFGVFVISAALEISGYLEHVTDHLFNRSKTGLHALMIIVFVLGFSSAFLMNDTVAIIGTPIILQLCCSHREMIKPLLLSLAFAITLGSVMSPIGNPQNLLIAVKANLNTPFISFIQYLFVTTLINLILTYLFVRFCFYKRLNVELAKVTPAALRDPWLTRLAQIALMIMLSLIILKILVSLFAWHKIDFNFSYIALVAAVPILLLSGKCWQVLRKIDWGTLIFFVSMFILMQSVWDSGFLQNLIGRTHVIVTNIHSILLISVLLSQLISNVPLVALYLPLLLHADASMQHLLALAAGSTIAGNLLIFGAASNIIIISVAEKNNAGGIGFLEFAKVGVPITIMNILVYWLFLFLL